MGSVVIGAHETTNTVVRNRLTVGKLDLRLAPHFLPLLVGVVPERRLLFSGPGTPHLPVQMLVALKVPYQIRQLLPVLHPLVLPGDFIELAEQTIRLLPDLEIGPKRHH